MVQPTKSTGSFDGVERTRFFHDEDLRAIPFWIDAKLAQFVFGDISALTAKRKTLFDCSDSLRQSQRVVLLGFQNMERQALGRLLSYAGQADQFANESGQETLIVNSHN